jgi:hypothetical protein
MAAWEVRLWVDASGKKPVRQWLNSLTPEELKSVSKELKLLAICGNEKGTF